MNDNEFITKLEDLVKHEMGAFLQGQPIAQLASIDATQALVLLMVERLAKAAFEGWRQTLEAATREMALVCPGCGGLRKCKRRPDQTMKIKVWGFELHLPKLYLECNRCAAPGVSITKVLTGLSSGDATMELELISAYASSEHSYGKASRDIEAHHGQRLERTAIRRMALSVEARAMEFVEEERKEALAPLEQEARTKGVEQLMVQADGGSVRTGTLVPCEPGDEGFGKTTAVRGTPRRKRLSQKREVITIDVRRPGQMEPDALDVMVPVLSPQGERARRMLASAGRSGLGDTTQVVGLGDLGSKLPESFDEAFVGYHSLYSGDWTHARGYVEAACAVLESSDSFDPSRWSQQMRDALWNRDAPLRDVLLEQAREHRVAKLPEWLERCPVLALTSYVTNNWHRMNAAQLKAMGLDFISARAESQVRDRTKSRFSVPGAWRIENVEGKATLRSIIAEGSWSRFRSWCLARGARQFEQGLLERLERAQQEGRLSPVPVDVQQQSEPQASFQKAPCVENAQGPSPLSESLGSGPSGTPSTHGGRQAARHASLPM